ncbi:MAG: PAS domain-containing protein [Campylobacteraceae bacterium]|nr:PAS domain-containing protein [Campylobacteraceae bacterium]
MSEIKLEKDSLIVSETDEKGILIYANEEFCKISGYTKDELIGQDNNIVRHPDMPKETSLELWNAIQAGEIWNGIVKNKTKNGDFYWLNATAYASKDAKGNKRYISIRVKPTDSEIKNAIALYNLSE